MSRTDVTPVRLRGVRAGRWLPVAYRSSGTVVHRVESRRRTWYVKTVPAAEADALGADPAGEATRLEWLRRHGFPTPEVAEVGSDSELAWLVTTAVEGRLASGPWSPDEQPLVLDAMADLTRALHALPAADCPFDRSLAVTLPLAALAARTGRVDLDDLDDQHRGWTAQRLLDALRATPPPAEDRLVVCHGDLCLDNVVVGPDTMTVTGVLDVGRLGRADRWLDLAIVLRNLADVGRGELPERHERFLRRYGLSGVDEQRCRYYQLLDEFF